jgi:uncharacterized protein (TIGR03435 family)
MSRTKTIVAVIVVVLLLAAAVGVKLLLFPSIKDAYFTMNGGSLPQVPANLVVIRPTHFASSTRKGTIYANVRRNGKNIPRIMGRNVPLSEVFATAYEQDVAKVVMPPAAPKGNYDFLVTSDDSLQEHLKTALRKKLGYTANLETRDAPVLDVKVENDALPGLTVSAADAKENEVMKNGRLYITHLKLTDLIDGLQQMLKTPVVDKTGLTNFYDFSLVWNSQVQRGQLDRAAVEKILEEWGLGLESDTASLQMLFVKKAD